MSRSIESQLNESYRDALVAYYLSDVVPNSPELFSLGLNSRLKTANDLYEFFLLDNQVTQDVRTSPVASAISSIQQYINGALMGMEPGYDQLRPDEARFVEWRDRSSQYPIWAANMQLALYPEVYISPALRLKKSSYFAQLENDINQNKITVDTAQEAVKSYLASFEEVANLTVINGYIDSDRFAEGKYYFLGKSRAENMYYWRMVDMNERAYISGTDGPKDDNPTPGAWSDWKRANIGINANTLERTIRPVYFNNRLFMSWVDLAEAEGEVTVGGTDERPTATAVKKVKLTFNLSYKKYDDSWSAPQIYMEVVTADSFTLPEGGIIILSDELNTIAAFDVSSSPESLFIAMYAGERPDQDHTESIKANYAFIATTYIDKNFNRAPIFPTDHKIESTSTPSTHNESRVQNICWTFCIQNKNNLQFTWYPNSTKSLAMQNIITTAPHSENPDYNYQNQQACISDITDSNNALTIDREHSALYFKTTIEYDINGSAHPIYDIHISTGEGEVSFHLIPSRFQPDDSYIHLDETSSMRISRMGESTTSITFRLYTPQTIDNCITDLDGGWVKVPEGWNSDTLYSLPTHKINKSAADYMRNNQALNGAFFYYSGGDSSHSTDVQITATTTEAAPYLQRLQLLFPSNMNPDTTSLHSPFAQSQPAPQIKAPSPLTGHLNYNKDDLSLSRFYLSNADLGTRYFILHGLQFLSGQTVVGRALKMTQFELYFQDVVATTIISPRITTTDNAHFGIAEYIDFSDSEIQFSDGSASVKREPIRMNTLFARELINKANIALEALLSWDTQLLPEPPIGDETESSKMDFKGANGLYFWELFLHLPFMVSHRLNLEQQFSEAEQWLGFIFDPGRKAFNSAPAYWNVRPLVELPDPDYFMRAPIDPDGIAASDPVKYQKAVYFHYIKNLIDRGDMAYRQLTPDSLGEAKLWYVRILDLLGPKPDTLLVSRWTPASLQAVADSTSAPLREFASRLEQQEQHVRSSALANDGKSLISFSEPPLRLSTFGSDPTLAEEDNDRFITPMNAELVKYWDMLESRLYNLRHNLTLDGKPLSLPLFAAPLDPRALLAAYANGATGGGAGSLMAQEVPHYRYAVMFNRASAAVETLIQFGATLLSIIERREQGQLMELQQQQAWEFAQFAIDLQLEAQKVEVEARKALQASKAIADARADFYGRLAVENVSSVEIAAAAERMVARVSTGVAATASAVASGMKTIPDHIGTGAGAIGGTSNGASVNMAVGGSRLEGVPETAAVLANAFAVLHDSIGDALERTEIFRRRRQEWENARDQATLEAEQITGQLAVHDAQALVTTLQLRQAEAAKVQAVAVHAFLNKRFTNSQLYGWLNGQFSTFYYQAYDATLSLCLAAQSCWQYEIADYSTSFIQPGAWKDAYRGLAAGEALKLNLLRMDAAYLARNERKLEIVKTVSVKQLPVDEQTLNKGWDAVVKRLAEGIAEFEITQAILDADYPDHYLRRIKRISVSLPVTVGPYQDIRATLTQSYNAVQMNALAGGPLKENMRASQQIAVSSGVDDDGLFVFNFDDERYLPFEGTGAISRWALSFANPDSQREMIDSITDIIVHMRYTAKSAGIY